ncbi:MAG: hypothetical protein ACYC10_14780 [Allorhizobium sp.]
MLRERSLLSGADVATTASALLRHGVGHMHVLSDHLTRWLAVRGLDSHNSIRGKMSHRTITNPEAFERATQHRYAICAEK